MNTAPFFWLIAAVGFLVLEGCTFNMTSIWFAIGAAAALISCLFTDLFRVQALLFIVVSVLCLLAFRPLAAKLRKAPTAPTGARHALLVRASHHARGAARIRRTTVVTVASSRLNHTGSREISSGTSRLLSCCSPPLMNQFVP